MGYYTRHEMYITCDVSSIKNILEEIKKNDYLDCAFALDKAEWKTSEEGITVYLPCYVEVKWYNEPEDMRKLARQFPEAIFIVHGKGEDRDDVWEHYYHGDSFKERHIVISWGEWT